MEGQIRTYRVEYTDTKTGATSPIDTVIAPLWYTARKYLSDCEKLASPEWNKMLAAGEVCLVACDA